LLVDNNEEHLAALRDKIQNEGTNVEVQVIPFDFKNNNQWQDYE
jgi:short-subunit dehydrogenase